MLGEARQLVLWYAGLCDVWRAPACCGRAWLWLASVCAHASHASALKRGSEGKCGVRAALKDMVRRQVRPVLETAVPSISQAAVMPKRQQLCEHIIPLWQVEPGDGGVGVEV